MSNQKIRELKDTVNNQDNTIFMLTFFLIFIGLVLIGFIIGFSVQLNDAKSMGKMICDDMNENFTYYDFDSNKKIVKCEDNSGLKPFDGGNVMVLTSEEIEILEDSSNERSKY